MVKTLQIMANDKIVCMLLDMYVGEKYKRSFTYTKQIRNVNNFIEHWNKIKNGVSDVEDEHYETGKN